MSTVLHQCVRHCNLTLIHQCRQKRPVFQLTGQVHCGREVNELVDKMMEHQGIAFQKIGNGRREKRILKRKTKTQPHPPAALQQPHHPTALTLQHSLSPYTTIPQHSCATTMQNPHQVIGDLVFPIPYSTPPPPPHPTNLGLHPNSCNTASSAPTSHGDIPQHPRLPMTPMWHSGLSPYNYKLVVLPTS